MIHPSPTTKIAPHLARGVLERIIPCPEGADGPEGCELIVLSVPNSSYRIHLRPCAECSPEAMAARIGKRIVGSVHVDARRIDIVETGGRYLEPVFGRPRRIQGRVIELAPGPVGQPGRTLVIDAGPIPVHARLTDERQSTDDFAVGTLVSFDALDGATFRAIDS